MKNLLKEVIQLKLPDKKALRGYTSDSALEAVKVIEDEFNRVQKELHEELKRLEQGQNGNHTSGYFEELLQQQQWFPKVIKTLKISVVGLDRKAVLSSLSELNQRRRKQLNLLYEQVLLLKDKLAVPLDKPDQRLADQSNLEVRESPANFVINDKGQGINFLETPIEETRIREMSSGFWGEIEVYLHPQYPLTLNNKSILYIHTFDRPVQNEIAIATEDFEKPSPQVQILENAYKETIVDMKNETTDEREKETKRETKEEIREETKEDIRNEIQEKNSQSQRTKSSSSAVAAEIQNLRERYIVGKIAGGDLRDHEGRLIITRHSVITPQIVEHAEREGKLAELIVAMIIPDLIDK